MSESQPIDRSGKPGDRSGKHARIDREAVAGGHVEIDGIRLKLAHPYESPGQWIGQQEILMQLLACWISLDASDLPLTPRLIGAPGVGKTQLAIAGSKSHGKPLFIYQCTADTRPEDLLITPVLEPRRRNRLSRVALGNRHGDRWRVCAGRRESDEREVVGLAGAAVG